MDDHDEFPPVSDNSIGSVWSDTHGVAYVLQWLDDVVREGLGAFCWVALGRV
jgi:hypothetical protein